MRELKFRCWNPDSFHPKGKEYEMVYSDDDLALFFDSLNYYTDYETYLMQYTGLKDKDGKEIYEQDCVIDNVGREWVIKYNTKKAGFYFYYMKNMSHSQPYSGFIKVQKPFEIIRNMYEKDISL